MTWPFKTKGLPAGSRAGGVCAIWLVLANAASFAQAETLVFAAASLRDVLQDVAQLSDTKVTVSATGSGTIARQVAQGAPADVIVLAHDQWMDWLETEGVVDPSHRHIVARNTLVVIGPAKSAALQAPNDMLDRLGTDRLAMGQRDAVPAGLYAKAWLQRVELWDKTKNQLAETDNVRGALAFVARGEAPLGIVYATDAQADINVSVVYDIPPQDHPPITYPGAALTPAGAEFLTLLKSEPAQLVFEQHGFKSP
ncbi:Molybdate-binding periplasmic protein [Ascidiaceihabitans donghaensis]|uniref:Molybdate-binding periplasmic protein n=1 Tax=Ascidiaceihabitans donghaensis TaxID=1510460 RepID=A0A2R8BG70_9RHOB|nr:molybdate ABC transporter substrate-binding protein [Ascidiaceihabitans donghaensis]SPH22061.1 Molybdate-binding periplasmic protein [Ascidiaceihabitans donghaensis]